MKPRPTPTPTILTLVVPLALAAAACTADGDPAQPAPSPRPAPTPRVDTGGSYSATPSPEHSSPTFAFRTADGQTLPGRAEVQMRPERVTQDGSTLPAGVNIFLVADSVGGTAQVGGGPGVLVEVAMAPAEFLASSSWSFATTAPGGALVPGDPALGAVFASPGAPPQLLPQGTVSLTRSVDGIRGVVATGTAEWGDITFEGLLRVRCMVPPGQDLELPGGGKTDIDSGFTTPFCAQFAGIFLP